MAPSRIDTQRLEERLVAERNELTADLPNVGEVAEMFAKDEVQDPEELSVQDAQGEVELNIIDRRSSRLALVEDALRRITEGTYGTCAECGERISPARLEADPAVALCIDCQRRAEETDPPHTPEL